LRCAQWLSAAHHKRPLPWPSGSPAAALDMGAQEMGDGSYEQGTRLYLRDSMVGKEIIPAVKVNVRP